MTMFHLNIFGVVMQHYLCHCMGNVTPNSPIDTCQGYATCIFFTSAPRILHQFPRQNTGRCNPNQLYLPTCLQINCKSSRWCLLWSVSTLKNKKVVPVLPGKYRAFWEVQFLCPMPSRKSTRVPYLVLKTEKRPKKALVKVNNASLQSCVFLGRINRILLGA